MVKCKNCYYFTVDNMKNKFECGMVHDGYCFGLSEIKDPEKDGCNYGVTNDEYISFVREKNAKKAR